MHPQCTRPHSFTQEQVDKFWSRVDMSGGPSSCWPWTMSRHKFGYGRMNWIEQCPDNPLVHVCAHRVALILSLGGHIGDLHTLHKCGNPACCNPKHLYAGTPKDNMNDTIDMGRRGELLPQKRDRPVEPPRKFSGERNSHSRLTEDDVREILRRYALRDITHSELAKEFGVSRSAIWMITSGRNWRHISLPDD